MGHLLLINQKNEQKFRDFEVSCTRSQDNKKKLVEYKKFNDIKPKVVKRNVGYFT